MNYLQAVAAGTTGALVLTILHETTRQFVPTSPRMDLLGMRTIDKYMRKAHMYPPQGKKLHTAALIGDIISNSLYYSMTGIGKKENVWLRATGLGLGAGIGAIVLPPYMGLSNEPSARTSQTKAMTVAWYLVGSLTAAAALQWFSKK